jgi:hypothetical protein
LPKVRKYIFLSFLLSELYFNSFAQFYKFQNAGFSVGAVIAVGNRFHRVGLNLQGYYFYDFVQVNAGVRLYRNFNNLGPKKVYNEAVVSGGLVFAAGGKQSFFNPFLSSYSNQTKRKFSLAYSYNAYFNRVRTKQQTGTVAFQFGEISFIAENDLLAKPALDRFRTGAFLLQYQYKNVYQAAINCTMWTGQMGRAIRDDKDFPYIGYMDTTGGIYTNYSHGLLSAQFKLNAGYAQNVQANFGVDAEQVRNFVQNRIIHDMVFIPRKWFKPINCHIPMIDSTGNQYLYKPGLKVRKPEFYWNFFSNQAAFY